MSVINVKNLDFTERIIRKCYIERSGATISYNFGSLEIQAINMSTSLLII